MNLIIVFVSGMVLMSLEITASRVLAPFFGTTALVWSTIIGVILLGISIGYYLGGTMADKICNNKILFLIIVAAALLLLLVVPLMAVFANAPKDEPTAWAALLYSTILFLGPAVFMGIITTYSVRLQSKDVKEFGRINGLLYGSSTLGSVFGVYLSGFYLIPRFTLTSIFYLLSACLFAVSIVALFMSSKKSFL